MKTLRIRVLPGVEDDNLGMIQEIEKALDDILLPYLYQRTITSKSAREVLLQYEEMVEEGETES